MVISVNPEPDRSEFEALLANAVHSLKNEAHKDFDRYINLQGNKLENEVAEVLEHNAKGTPFEGSIELISGQKFPDIVAKKYYGVEVKTTKSNQWKSTGSSVAEGTRVDGVERIFMMFGKMCDPIDFICRPYEECLSEVVVTHSPRYLIDMTLKKGETIFDKIDTPYDVLRKLDDPINTVLDYYRAKLGTGESTWWSPQREEVGSKIIIRLWKHLSRSERSYYINKALCLFPEIVSNRQDKYNRLAIWLSTRESVVCTNIRDMFTAGGQGDILFEGVNYSRTPRIVTYLTDNIQDIKRVLSEIDRGELEEYWDGINCHTEDIYSLWGEMIVDNAKSIAPYFPLCDFSKVSS